MNETEHLLACLSEECAEVAQAVGKALRFGLNDASPSGTLPPNREYIARELIDVIAVAEMLRERGILPQFGTEQFDAIEAKKKSQDIAFYGARQKHWGLGAVT